MNYCIRRIENLIMLCSVTISHHLTLTTTIIYRCPHYPMRHSIDVDIDIDTDNDFNNQNLTIPGLLVYCAIGDILEDLPGWILKILQFTSKT